MSVPIKCKEFETFLRRLLMKLLICCFLLVSFMSQAFSSDDINVKCTQRTDRSPVDPKVGKISVSVKVIEDITSKVKFGKKYDAVYRANVKVMLTKNGKTSVIKSFEATATSYDVQFNVWANKTHGVGFYTYFDEMEESGITLTDTLGKKTEISLDCR